MDYKRNAFISKRMSYEESQQLNPTDSAGEQFSENGSSNYTIESNPTIQMNSKSLSQGAYTSMNPYSTEGSGAYVMPIPIRCMYGSNRMQASEIQYVLAMSNRIPYENSSFIEDYYYIHAKEREAASAGNIVPVSVVSDKEEKNIKRRVANQKNMEIERSRIWSTSTHTLGINLKSSVRTPQLLIDISPSQYTEEENVGLSTSHWKIMKNIEEGFDALLEIDKIKRRELYQDYNPNSPPINEEINYNRYFDRLKHALYLEGENEFVTVKTKHLLRLAKSYKGKKLLISARPYLSAFSWKVILSSLMPFILLWLDTRDQWKEEEIEVNESITQTLIEVIKSPELTLELLYDILLAIVNSKTVQMIPDFLQADPYSVVYDTFFNKGEILSESSSLDTDEEESFVKNKWISLMDELIQLLSGENN